jgi:polysaccharide pyruvyl transferase WcaK-like protein
MTQKAYIFKNRYTPSQILGIVGCFNLMISMRLHTLIFAAIKNVPMLGVIYDPKVEYYLKELEMPEAGDVRNSRLDSADIYAKVCDIFANMPKYKSLLQKNADIMCSKASENDKLLNEQLEIIRNKKR